MLASACVVQVTLVPGEFTSGSAKHWRPELQGVASNFPFTHCAKLPLTQACSPSSARSTSAGKYAAGQITLPLQGLLAVSVANFALSACASWPFWWAKPFEADAWPDGAAAAAAEEDAGVAEAARGATDAEDVAEALAEAAGGATEAGAEDAADEGDAATGEAEGVFWELPLPAPFPEGRPEEVTKSES